MPPLMMSNPVMSASTGSSTPLTLAQAAQWLVVAQQQQQVQSAPNITVDSLIVQQNQLQEQIRQSEQNLAAQHTVIPSFVFIGISLLIVKDINLGGGV